MKKIILIVFCLVVAYSISHASSGIKWYSYEEGILNAKKNGKKIFLHFGAPWCGYCTKMKNKTFNDFLVSDYLNTNFISIKINTDKEKKIASKYYVKGLPDSWFLTKKGEKIGNLPGYIPPEKFLSMLKYILTDSYKNMNYKKFLETKNNRTSFIIPKK